MSQARMQEARAVVKAAVMETLGDRPQCTLGHAMPAQVNTMCAYIESRIIEFRFCAASFKAKLMLGERITEQRRGGSGIKNELADVSMGMGTSYRKRKGSESVKGGKTKKTLVRRSTRTQVDTDKWY